MPDRYWVGGTASWDGTAGTKWATASGGMGGASVPTTADDVFFDAGSNTGAAITVTIATGNTGARSINCTGFTRTITGSAAITVAGSVTLVAAMTYTYSGVMTFTGTGTLTTAGKSFNTTNIDGAGITLTLGDAISMASARAINLFTGTFTTNNFAVTCGAFSSTGTNIRALNLGSSTVTISGTTGFLLSSTGLTVSAASSTINMTSTSFTTFSGAGFTYGAVSFTNASNLLTVSGANTFSSLSITAPSSSGVLSVRFSADQTVSGTLTCSGPANGRRNYLRSDIEGAARTLTVATLAANGADFRDITIAGAASGTTLVNAGDCGGNSGIVFPAPRSVFRVGTGAWDLVNTWALSSGGTGNAFPLAQDTAVFDNSTPGTTISLGTNYNIGTLNASARTIAYTINHNASFDFYGSYILGSGITVSGISFQNFLRRGVMDFTSAGKTITFPMNMNGIGGTLRLTAPVTSSSSFTLVTGTLDLNNFALTIIAFSSDQTSTRALAFGTGSITVTTTGTVWNTATDTNGMTVTGTPVVNVTNATATAVSVTAGTPSEANSISFNFTAGTYSLTLSNVQVRSLNFTGFAGTLVNGGRTIFGDLTLSTGMTVSAGAASTTFGSTSGTVRTIQPNGKMFDFPVTFNGAGGTFRLLGTMSLGPTRTLTHANGTLDLNGFSLAAGASYTTAAGTKNITFNFGALVCPGSGSTAFNNAAPAGFTTTSSVGSFINMTSASAKTFVGGDAIYNCTLNNGGAGALTITGSNTFTTLSNNVQPTSFLFTAGTTTTLTNWNINGTAGNLVTINSSTAGQHTLLKSSGAVSADYLSITNSFATGGATWGAGPNSVNGGNNIGWFGISPSNFLMLLF
jgi:hypothetical protein